MKFVTFFVAIFISALVLANDGRIQGHIKDAKDEFDLKDVIVQLQNENISTLSTSSGFFDLTEIKYGTYYVIFSRKGYYSLVIPDVKVENSKPVKLEIDMVEGDEKEYLFLEIGGIQVTASRELLSEEPETVHKITSGEIEHMQANSLANVLSLIPGNIQDNSPGLQKKQNITIRGFEDSGELFGTSIIVDDIPMSNNANLQTGIGVNYGSSVQSTVNTQYDLREVVAENLEKVEVLSGATSVEYGDHSQGIILAKTKTINVPTRLKIRNNPDTREGNLMGGISAFNTDFIYNFNYGYSERDIRVTGDEYHRISGDLKIKNKFDNINLKMMNIFKYGRKIEEDDDASDPEGTKAYNRDYNITYSNQFDYQWDELTRLYLRNYVNFRKRNSWKRRLETPDLAIWTDRMTPGTREGIIPESATYYSEVTTIGQEWNYGSKLKLERKMLSGNTLHRFLLGAEYKTDDNNGSGKSYDLLNPPGGKTSSRPRSFDDTPGTVQFALFGRDRITGEWIFPFTLDLGFRIDSYNPTGLQLGNLFKDKDVFNSDQGTFFNPRMGLKIKVAPKTQIRFTFSKSSKTPPISSIYPEDYFLDVYDLAYRIITDSLGNQYQENYPLVSTYAYNRSNLKLKGYQSTKYELSFDQQIGDFGLSLSGYYQTTNGIHKSVYIPYVLNQYFWLDWPDTTNKILLASVLLKDSKYKVANNLGKSESSGLEFRLTSHRIKPLNMIFKINGAFTFKKYSSSFYKNYGSTFTFDVGDTLPSGNIANEETQVIPYYNPGGNWRQRAVLNYHLDYMEKTLGIWLTFKAQQVLFDENLSYFTQNLVKPENWDVNREGSANVAAVGYYMDGNHYTIDSQTSNQVGFDKSYEYNSVNPDRRPNDRWMFSIVASKTLFEGAEVSLFVDNIFNDRAYYKTRNDFYSARNHEIHWGIGFSCIFDKLFQN